MSSVDLVPDFYPQTLNRIMAVLQRHLLRIYLLLNIEDNSPAPLSLSISSENLVLHHIIHTYLKMTVGKNVPRWQKCHLKNILVVILFVVFSVGRWP